MRGRDRIPPGRRLCVPPGRPMRSGIVWRTSRGGGRGPAAYLFGGSVIARKMIYKPEHSKQPSAAPGGAATVRSLERLLSGLDAHRGPGFDEANPLLTPSMTDQLILTVLVQIWIVFLFPYFASAEFFNLYSAEK